MSLKALREAVFARAEWSPGPTEEAVTRVNSFINSAVLDLARDCPFAMFEKEQILFTQPVVEPASSSDTIELVEWDAAGLSQEFWGGSQEPVNPWVFKATLAPGSGTTWKVDRTWDGRFIEIIDTDGTVYRNQIRTVWRDLGAAGYSIDEYRFSVVHPFPHDTLGTGPFEWRILSGQHYLPNDCLRPKYVRLEEDDYSRTIEFYTREQAQRLYIQNRFADGPPIAAVRHTPMTMKAPTVAPTVAQGDGDWVGPEPAGSFKYRITYTWGKQDGETQGPGMGLFYGEAGDYTTKRVMVAPDYSENRMKLPKWESPPSLESATVEVTMPGEGAMGNDIDITIPNIEYVLGFLMAGTQRSSGSDLDFSRANTRRSGWNVAIYRKRVTTDFTDYDGTPASGTRNVIESLNKIEESDDYYLLAEMRIDPSNQGQFTDDGSILPDYSRPLRSTGTHLGFELYPAPDERYPIRLVYASAPSTLVDDTDVPPVLLNAREALIERSLYYTLRMMGDPRAMESASRYEDEVETIRKEMGTVVPEAQIVRKRAARSGRSRHRYRSRWGQSEV